MKRDSYSKLYKEIKNFNEGTTQGNKKDSIMGT